jgi:hypothetical protein
MASKSLIAFPQLRSADNVHYQLLDAQGHAKPLFQENRLCKALLKAGVLSPLWINSEYAPYLMPFFGHWATEKVIGNLVTNAGLALTAGLLNGSGSPAAATYIAVGTGTTAAAATDTALQTETATSGLSRAAGTVSLVTTSVTNDTSQITKTFSVTGTVAVTESGVLNAASTGTLLCRQVFSAINVANGDSLAITWKVQHS